MRAHPRAVIDIGSNSARVVVFQFSHGGTVDVIADDRSSLRLIRELDERRFLRGRAQERTLRTLRDFRQLALGAGARRIIAVGTAALREAANGAEFLDRIHRDVGVRLRIVNPREEAEYALLGAVYGLPVKSGMVVDIGGGSLQIASFRDRKVTGTRSLPLGALRLSDRFLGSDPPSRGEIRELRTSIHAFLRQARIRSLRSEEVLVGTGGTIRNLAKIDSRNREYPVPRLHGYALARGRLQEISAVLVGRKRSALSAIPGLNRERADSIAGGSVIAECLMDCAGSGRMIVAGLGLREGLLIQMAGAPLPDPDTVRAQSVSGLVRRFASWDRGRALRRRALASMLYERLEARPAEPYREMLLHAAVALDIGRSVDYYRRHSHTAMILRSTGLLGFGHREILALSTIAEMSDGNGWDLKKYRPLLHEDDHGPIERAAMILALADGIEHRMPPGAKPALRCEVSRREIVLRDESITAWNLSDLGDRFRRGFHRELRIRR